MGQTTLGAFWQPMILLTVEASHLPHHRHVLL